MSINTLLRTEPMTAVEAVKDINNHRRRSKERWYVWLGNVNGKDVRLKAFNLWVQRLEIGKTYYEISANSVHEFKEELQDILS